MNPSDGVDTFSRDSSFLACGSSGNAHGCDIRPSTTTEAAALAGDHSAWNSPVTRHNQKVITVLIAHGVRPAIARELAQDTWLRLLKQATEHRIDRLELPGLARRQR